MNREQRKRRLQLKPHVDRLEMRRLMSQANAKSYVAQALAKQQAALESELAHGDLDLFADTLAHSPRLAARMGLGALGFMLRRSQKPAQRDGWGATLVRELAAHPRYAAAHDLTALIKPPAQPKINPIITQPLSTPPSPPIAQPPQPVAQPPQQSPPVAQPPQPPQPVAQPPQPVAPASSPPTVTQDPLSVAVGSTLDVTLPNLGISGTDVTFTITPQPLPANMTFNRGTGELVFSPAPDQVGVSSFSVVVSNGTASGTIVVPVTVTAPPLPSTEVSGRVVDENGNPLAGMPVSIGSATTVTDQAGDFTLTAIPANPGPISAGGAAAASQGRQALMAPVVQLLGHPLYSAANNVMPAPLIVPTIDWSPATAFSQTSESASLDITNPAMTGFDIRMATTSAGTVQASGTVKVAELSAALSAQHMSPGVSTGMVLFNVSGTGISDKAQLTLPNTDGFPPGSVLYLMMLNPLTGGHDVAGRMVVSADGKTMTSTGLISLSPSSAGPPPAVTPDGGDPTYIDCLYEETQPTQDTQVTPCGPCQASGNGRPQRQTAAARRRRRRAP
jgi:Bacterial Ig domain